MDRTDIQEIKNRLQRAGAWSKKSLGQHFLIDRNVLDGILRAAALQPEDTVVEIGPGIGVLTECLAAQAKRVLSFEIDTDLAALMRADFPKVEIIEGDVLQTAPVRLPGLGAYQVVANIPYQITTPLIRLFLESGLPAPEQMTLLMQREVAERLAAGPGKSGRGYLSVLCQYYAETEVCLQVPQNAFWPEPAVRSAVIRLKMRQTRALPSDDERPFFRMVQSLFIQPRKQLKNVLAGMKGCDTALAADYLQKMGFKPTVRAQEVPVEGWLEVYKHPFHA